MFLLVKVWIEWRECVYVLLGRTAVRYGAAVKTYFLPSLRYHYALQLLQTVDIAKTIKTRTTLTSRRINLKKPTKKKPPTTNI